MTEEQLNAAANVNSADSSKQSSPRERSSRSNNRLFPVSTYSESTPTHASTITTTAATGQPQQQQQQSDYQPNTPSK